MEKPIPLRVCMSVTPLLRIGFDMFVQRMTTFPGKSRIDKYERPVAEVASSAARGAVLWLNMAETEEAIPAASFWVTHSCGNTSKFARLCESGEELKLTDSNQNQQLRLRHWQKAHRLRSFQDPPQKSSDTT